jgi:predicted site-specific integrase-resolvase
MRPPQTPSLPRRAYKLSEFSTIVGISNTTARRLIKRGLLTPCRVLRHILITHEELERFIATNLK